MWPVNINVDRIKSLEGMQREPFRMFLKAGHELLSSLLQTLVLLPSLTAAWVSALFQPGPSNTLW